MSVGNFDNHCSYDKSKAYHNYMLNRQHSLPSIQLSQRNQRRIHLLPVYQKLSYEYEQYPEADSMASFPPGKTRHASIPIYRPPSLRENVASSQMANKLNVHAKEFVMASRNDDGRADGVPTRSTKSYPLNTSKSSNTVSFGVSKTGSSQHLKSTFKPLNMTSNQQSGNFSLQRTKSSGLIGEHMRPVNVQRVQFKSQIVDKSSSDKPTMTKERVKTLNLDQSQKSCAFQNTAAANALKRSKSLNAADAFKFMEMEASLLTSRNNFTEYHLFPVEVRDGLKMAASDPNSLADTQKIILARYVIDHALKGKQFSHPVARLSIIIVEKDKSSTFLDSLLNTCQMLYQKKSELLPDTARFNMFVTFLTEMYIELKQSKMQIRFREETTPPKCIVLKLICHCCEDILRLYEEHSLIQIECLFLALTSVGRDLETELSIPLKKLFIVIKEVFLKNTNPQIKKILLQLIELRAANWQLPVSALSYYYPTTSSN